MQKENTKRPVKEKRWDRLLKAASWAEDDTLYKIGWCLLAILCCYAMATKWMKVIPLQVLNGCFFHTMTGGYCPGCGGTRATIALLHGRVWQSFYYHPLVIYAVVVGGWFMVSQTIDRLSRGKTDIGMHYRHIYTVVGVGIMLVNCVVKNVMFFCFDITLQ